MAVYGVKLAGHENEFVDWQTKQEQSTRHVKKRYREWHWHGVPDLLANLEFVELVLEMKHRGYIDVYVEAKDYCADLKMRLIAL